MAYDLHVRRLKNVTCTYCRAVKRRPGYGASPSPHRQQNLGRPEPHESVWTCYVRQNHEVRVRGEWTRDYNQVRTSNVTVIKTFCRHCWDEQMSHAIDYDWGFQFDERTKFVMHHQDSGIYTTFDSVSRPWWLYLPGYSPLTRDEQNWTRDLSSLLGYCLGIDPAWWDNFNTRNVGDVRMTLAEWDVHPANDYCREHGIDPNTYPADGYGLDRDHDGRLEYPVMVWFKFPKVESEVLV